jgi:hypothetical protein
MNTRYRRIAALGIFFCVFAGFLAGEVFILAHADHDHTGEACPTCAQMEDVADVLRRLSEGLPVAPAHQALLSLSVSLFLFLFFNNTCETLVTRKVRLND